MRMKRNASPVLVTTVLPLVSRPMKTLFDGCTTSISQPLLAILLLSKRGRRNSQTDGVCMSGFLSIGTYRKFLSLLVKD